MSRPDYHPFLPKPGQSKIAGPTARAHAEARRQSPRAKEFFAQWEKQLAEPFKGITTDGQAVPGLYKLEPNGAPLAAMTDAAQGLLSLLTEAQRKASCFTADSMFLNGSQTTENFFEDY